jgi:sigma-B regulation protein RsbU (phosphoserine phosphatase)
MIKLPDLSALKAQVKRTVRPKTKWGRVTLWTGGLSVLLYALGLLTSWGSSAKPGGWTRFFALVFALFALRLVSRWAWRRVMWRLRHRLIVTYLFIGVIPLLLLLNLAGVGGYLLAGQFATYVAISNLQSAVQHLEAENDALAVQLSTESRSGESEKQLAAGLSTVSAERFPGRTVTVWHGDVGFTLSTAGALLKAHPAHVPDAVKEDYSGFVLDGESLHLRAVKRFTVGGQQRTVISDLPITPELLQSATSQLGSATLILPAHRGDLQVPAPAVARPTERRSVATAPLATTSNRYDRSIHFATLFSALDWETGKKDDCAILVATRLSLLYHILFSTLGDKAPILLYGLLAIAILLGLVELAALFIGIRLSRSMTRAVAELYRATEHINRGDLTHRIRIRGSDQMAVLQQSFNSMSESLVKLLAEQKQMQRMESELAIANEVQKVLFPASISELNSLEVYGVCRPARSVSGDYYDFIPLGSGGLMLALGDISGKGISAALLMATVHAFVRAYSLEANMGSIPPAWGTGMLSKVDRSTRRPGDGAAQSRPSVSMLMSTLNHQLFRCTSPEKYATMFLGCYNAALSEFTYCNAGHLPPILLGENESLSRLETSGTVVGLFDGEVYGESTIRMQPGDLFVAFSDGVTEPENDSGEFGEERLIALIQEYRHQPLSRIGEVITGSVADWIGDAEQPDDVTVVLARAR